MTVNRPNGHKIHIPTSSIARPSNIYPNWYFCFENMASGNPAVIAQLNDKGSNYL
jgi:hypothetical protein